VNKAWSIEAKVRKLKGHFVHRVTRMLTPFTGFADGTPCDLEFILTSWGWLRLFHVVEVNVNQAHTFSCFELKLRCVIGGVTNCYITFYYLP